MSRLGCKNLIPSTRALAKTKGEGRYFSKVCAKHPEYKGERLTASGHCYGCAKESVAKNQAVGGSQHERARAFTKRYYTENKATVLAKQKEYLATLSEEEQVRRKKLKEQWRAKNKERLLAESKIRNAKWKKEKPELNCAKENRRRATKLQATPKWGNEFFIKEAYHLAKIREKTLGGKWHVDHIVPLRSKLVCGLHVENNLQVIPALHNIAKNNRYWPQMPT